MNRWKRLSSGRLLATTFVLFASSFGGMTGCEDTTQPDPTGVGGEGGNGGNAGSGGNAGGGGSAGSGGGGGGCTVAVDCPGTDDACKSRTCKMGACGFDYAAVDTAVPSQTKGDCKLTVCDGNGTQIEKNDDNDLPDDLNPCTDDVCTTGAPSHPPKSQGTNCGTNGMGEPQICNGSGSCVGCVTENDCPGTDDECSKRTCMNGVCGRNFTPKDTVVMAQTANNCLRHVCDGAGKMVDIIDDTDLPADDGNSCTSETCTMGTPGHPAVTNGTSCSDNNACTQSDACQMGACVPGTPKTCTASDQCHIAGTCDPVSGMCSNPNATNGTMCNDGDACTQTDACNNGTCSGTNPVVCAAPDQCHLAGTCNSTTGMCVYPNAPNGINCDDSNACTQTDTCNNGTCTGANPKMCTASDQCHIAGMCNPMNGMCSNPNAPAGTMCTSNMIPGMCTTGTCIACGDGIITAPETCDDSDATGGDGCSATCTTESGYSCTGAPSTCVTVCGDGILRGTEQCDDKNMTNGDGCSSTCQLDIGCGMGEVPVIITNSTATIIPDSTTGAISLINVVQPGVVRKVIPTINVTHSSPDDLEGFLSSPFGVQRILVDNEGSGPNFTATAFSDTSMAFITTAMAPYTGTYKPNQTLSDAAGFASQTAAGPWVLRFSDDSTGLSGTINSWSLALCVDPSVSSTCGNGAVEANEQCDDGNAMSGDGCAMCQLEVTCAPNETFVFKKSNNGPLLIPAANSMGVQSTISVPNTGFVGKAVVVVNAISHAWDSDVAITLTSPSNTSIIVNSGNGGQEDNFASTIFDDDATTAASAGTAPFRGSFIPDEPLSDLYSEPTNGDWTLKVADSLNGDVGVMGTWSIGLCVAPPAVCGNALVEIGEPCDDGDTMAGDGCSATCTVEPGYTCTGTPLSTCTFTCGNGTISGNEQCDDGNTTSGDVCNSVCQWEYSPEVEPNSMCGTGTGPFTVPFIFDAAISPIGDYDFVAFNVPAYADVKIESFAPTVGTCPTADTVIQFRDTDCASVLTDSDDEGEGFCSLIDPATSAAAQNLPPGKYYVRIEEYNNDATIPSYKLQVTFAALCGDGMITGSEECDDSNTMSGDGCGDNCREEPGFNCMSTPGPCSPVCGDGLIRGGEACDDMNTNDTDGCSGTCTIESGYTCMGEPSVCTP